LTQAWRVQAKIVADESQPGVPQTTGGQQQTMMEKFVMTASQQARGKMALALALFENCGGVAVSFSEHPAMK
jgi:hypothetical protein